MTTFQRATGRGLKIFYRDAGSKASSTIVLLHGFPSSSHMFRDLIPRLADKFHVIAPDYVGFGYSDAPDAGKFDYTFNNLAAYIDELLFGVLGLKRFSIYVQDYGAPVGYRRPPGTRTQSQASSCRTGTPSRRHRSGLRSNEAVLGKSKFRDREACA
jgi:hypothetical protein